MKKRAWDALQLSCGRCGEEIPNPDPVVLCRCCGRIFCVRCVALLMIYSLEHEDRLAGAMRDRPDCIQTVFETIDRIENKTLRKSTPVPPREQRH